MPVKESEPWGPDNPHPLSRCRNELVWEGKYDAYGRRRPVRLPPFPVMLRRVEAIGDGACPTGAATERNLLIWGDNKLALAALREQFRGRVDLIYIDPPFAAGVDRTFDLAIGEDEDAAPAALAYRDRWGRGPDSYLHWMYERLVLLRELLTETGSLFVHCDYRVSHLLRAMLGELFGNTLRNELIWCYTGPGSPRIRQFNRKHDTLYWFSRRRDGHKFRAAAVRVPHQAKTRGNFRAGLRGSGFPAAQYDLPAGKIPEDWWPLPVAARYPVDGVRRTGYATEKPWPLLERILESASDPGDLVLDCFCGSGTTLAVAEALGRRWIGCDLGRHAIHTTRKRLIALQRERHAAGQSFRPFDLCTLGTSERRWWQMERLDGSNAQYRETVLRCYRAAPLAPAPSPLLHGTQGRAYVHVGDIDRVLTVDALRAVAEAAARVGAPELHCLAWEFAPGLLPRAQALAAELGVEIRLKQIPREIMEPNRSTVPFFEVGTVAAEAFLREGEGPPDPPRSGGIGEEGPPGPPRSGGMGVEGLPRSGGRGECALPAPPSSGGEGGGDSPPGLVGPGGPTPPVDVRLTGFVPSLAGVPEQELTPLRERAARSPFDLIDFWAVDFAHHEGKECFEHHWQAYRTRRDRSLPTESDRGWVYATPGCKQIRVKVVDVFGIETTTVVDVTV